MEFYGARYQSGLSFRIFHMVNAFHRQRSFFLFFSFQPLACFTSFAGPRVLFFVFPYSLLHASHHLQSSCLIYRFPFQPLACFTLYAGPRVWFVVFPYSLSHASHHSQVLVFDLSFFLTASRMLHIICRSSCVIYRVSFQPLTCFTSFAGPRVWFIVFPYSLSHASHHLQVLVFDLGGGTYDISLLEVGNGTIEVLSTGRLAQSVYEGFTKGVTGSHICWADRHCWIGHICWADRHCWISQHKVNNKL